MKISTTTQLYVLIAPYIKTLQITAYYERVSDLFPVQIVSWDAAIAIATPYESIACK